MRAIRFLAMGTLMLAFFFSADAASAKIIKTLPHYLDLEGRHTLRPSLFERDSYQEELKRHPAKCSGMRFDVQWKARELKGAPVRLRLEVRGAHGAPRQAEIFEEEIRAKGHFSQWTSIKVSGENFKRTGAILAWRLTLWNGEALLAEQKSFLW
jgi:hypothetical protein